jgi:hypothetical protein
MTDGQYFQYYLTLFSILIYIIINENKYIFKNLTKVQFHEILPNFLRLIL